MRRVVEWSYTESEIVGGGVNSPFYDAHPCIAADESYIIFDSDRPGGQGWGDLYICFRDRNVVWGETINLWEKINTTYYDGYASISPDGKFLFYARLKEGNFDIYWVSTKFIEKIKREKLK